VAALRAEYDDCLTVSARTLDGLPALRTALFARASERKTLRAS
jgi:hypothetical protein